MRIRCAYKQLRVTSQQCRVARPPALRPPHHVKPMSSHVKTVKEAALLCHVCAVPVSRESDEAHQASRLPANRPIRAAAALVPVGLTHSSAGGAAKCESHGGSPGERKEQLRKYPRTCCLQWPWSLSKAPAKNVKPQQASGPNCCLKAWPSPSTQHPTFPFSSSLLLFTHLIFFHINRPSYTASGRLQDAINHPLSPERSHPQSSRFSPKTLPALTTPLNHLLPLIQVTIRSI